MKYRAYRAADWNLAQPDWTGRLKVVAKGEKCSIKLEDKITGRRNRCPIPRPFYVTQSAVGELFAACPVRAFPGTDVEPVSDSSRYFLLKLEDTSGDTLRGVITWIM